MVDIELSRLAGLADMLVESIGDHAIFMLDPGGLVVSWNGGAERLKGYAAVEIIGQHFSRFYPDAEREKKVPELALRTAEREGRFEAEGWRVRKDGKQFWANSVIYPVRRTGGALVGFTKVTRDLTERMRSEEVLRRSEERFRLLVEGVTDYAFYMLDPDGRVTSWNAGAARFKGYTEAEIVGRHFSIFHTREDNEEGLPNAALRAAKDNGHFHTECWNMRKDGSCFWASMAIDPVRKCDGELLGFATVTRDLTERRELQIALEQARESYFQAQMMDAIGKLTGGVAHNFNNLLSSIEGSLELAERRQAAGQDITRFLEDAKRAVERGAELTQRLLAFARKQELKIEPVDIVATVSGMAELLSLTLGPGIEVRTQFPATLPTVRADAAQLELAVATLSVNARDAMPGGGWITIAAHPSNAGDTGLPPDDYVCLSVADQGIGMDETTLARATEPFFTTKGVGKGMGLGLSMVLGMVEQCGGRLFLHSRPDEGTTVELWLPVAPGRPSPDADRLDVQMHPSAWPLSILAVDDDIIVLMNTVAMLEDMGHQVFEASSGIQAVHILQERQIDLLVTDYAMPGMTGAELISRARMINAHLPVVLVSGYVDQPDALAIQVPRLSKPFSGAELAEHISIALRSIQ